MSFGFQTPLRVEEVGQAHGRTVYRLLDRLDYMSGSGVLYSVPAGFLTDWESLPRLPVISWLLGGRPVHRAATLHDWCYRKDSTPHVEREEADALFLEAMLSTGLSRVFAMPFYWGVRIGGAASYGVLSVTAELFHLVTARGKK